MVFKVTNDIKAVALEDVVSLLVIVVGVISVTMAMVVIFWVVGTFAMIMAVVGIFVVVRVVKMTVVVVMAIDREPIEVRIDVVVSNFDVEGIAVEDLLVVMVSIVAAVTGLFIIGSVVGIAVVVWMLENTLEIGVVIVGYWVV